MSVLKRRFIAVLAPLLVGLLLVSALSAMTRSAQATTGSDTLDILVLGDSYAAGNGAGDYYGPQGCFRSHQGWTELYAEGLRRSGKQVNLTNRACSGAVVADLVEPRTMGTTHRTSGKPLTVITSAQAKAWLEEVRPCDTDANPGEEFWTYDVHMVWPLTVDFSCTRYLRPQSDQISPHYDLVIVALGGNDVGFRSIVTQCFVPMVRTADSCRGAVSAAQSGLAGLPPKLSAGLESLFAAGLRSDAKLVQVGYPHLQLDNGFTISTPGQQPYPAGEAVRALVRDGTAGIRLVINEVNRRHPGQAIFLDGVAEHFAGHEPDARSGNPDRWILQVGDSPTIDEYYHPNPLGHWRLAELALSKGTFGAGEAPHPTATVSPTATSQPSPTSHPSPTSQPSPTSKPSPTSQPSPTSKPSPTDAPGPEPTITAEPNPGSSRKPTKTTLRLVVRSAGRVIVAANVTSGTRTVRSGKVHLLDGKRRIASKSINSWNEGVGFALELKPGRHRLRAVYVGTAKLRGSRSGVLAVKVG